MPLGPEIQKILSQAANRRELPRLTSKGDYLDKIPTLNSTDFSDDLTILGLTQATEHNYRLKALLEEAGLTKGQRVGISIMLGNIRWIGDYEVTVGDIRAMTLEQLFVLRHFTPWRHAGKDSMRVIKKLFGSGMESNVEAH